MIDREQMEAICDAAIGDLVALGKEAYESVGPPPFEAYEHQVRTAFMIGYGMGRRSMRTIHQEEVAQ